MGEISVVLEVYVAIVENGDRLAGAINSGGVLRRKVVDGSEISWPQ